MNAFPHQSMSGLRGRNNYVAATESAQVSRNRQGRRSNTSD